MVNSSIIASAKMSPSSATVSPFKFSAAPKLLLKLSIIMANNLWLSASSTKSTTQSILTALISTILSSSASNMPVLLNLQSKSSRSMLVPKLPILSTPSSKLSKPSSPKPRTVTKATKLLLATIICIQPVHFSLSFPACSRSLHPSLLSSAALVL